MKNNKDKVYIPVTRIDQLRDGDRVTCRIGWEGIEISNAKISIDKDGTIFICQNRIDGYTADNRKGYRYSWVCYRKGRYHYIKHSLEYYSVRDLKKEI